MTSKREFDLIVFGATGFTGALVAKYLLSNVFTDINLTWAIAGRSLEKLNNLKRDLGNAPDVDQKRLENVPIIIADSHNIPSLLKLVHSSRVILTTVGPYNVYGNDLIKLCAENGVHYCDLTGETLWIKSMAKQYAKVAEKTGARIVPFCGYDAVPPDICTFIIADAIKTKFNSSTSKITYNITAAKGSVSGGTCATVFSIFDNFSANELRDMQNPYHLLGENESLKVTQPQKCAYQIAYDSDLESYTSYSIAENLDRSVVQLSNYLLDNLYGHSLVFKERYAVGGLFMQILMTLLFAVLAVFMYFPWTRSILKRISPSPGEGPSEALIRQGFFVAHAFGYKSDGQLAISASVHGNGDPGYGFTSKVIAECAVLLAQGQWNDGSKAHSRGGFYTPASAFGKRLSERLELHDVMRVRVCEHIRF